MVFFGLYIAGLILCLVHFSIDLSYSFGRNDLIDTFPFFHTNLEKNV